MYSLSLVSVHWKVWKKFVPGESIWSTERYYFYRRLSHGSEMDSTWRPTRQTVIIFLMRWTLFQTLMFWKTCFETHYRTFSSKYFILCIGCSWRYFARLWRVPNPRDLLLFWITNWQFLCEIRAKCFSQARWLMCCWTNPEVILYHCNFLPFGT